MLIDTHCHLSDPVFIEDRVAVLSRAQDAGVTGTVLIESDLSRLDDTLAWVRSLPTARLATGCHPHDAERWDAALVERLRAVWADPLIGAAGEMGLDYHYDHAPRPVQRQVFAEQAALAEACGLPLVIHAREADDDVAAILRGIRVPVVLHSFSSGPGLAAAGLAAGWYFSFSGMITFRSWQQTDLLREVPTDRLLLETDAPYLAPVPHRGRRNEPAFLVATARHLAAARGMSLEVLAAATTHNAQQVFWARSS